MRRAFTLLAFAATVLLADASTADAQYRSRGQRGTAVLSIGFGNGVLSYGQSYYGGQSYTPFGNVYGNQIGYPSNGYGHNQTYYSTPNYYGGQRGGYSPTYSPYGQPHYYRRR